MIPIIMLCGEAGSGKDTIAGILVKNHGAQHLALADPLKRFGMKVFGFTEEQLWGPSENRNVMDPKFALSEVRESILANIQVRNGIGGACFVDEVLSKDFGLHQKAYRTLENWAERLLAEAKLEGGLTPRKFLQTLGDDWGRRIDPDLWIKYALRVSRSLFYYGGIYQRTLGIVASDKPVADFVVISDGRYRNEVLAVRELGGEVWKIRSSIDIAVTSSAGIVNHRSEVEQRSIPDFYYTAILDNDKSKGLEAAEVVVQSMAEKFVNRKPFWYSTRYVDIEYR